MTGTIQSPTGPRHRVRHLLLFTALGGALIGIVLVASAGARSARVVGKTNHTPDPACPRNCSAVGKVTAFQRVADGKNRPFFVRKNGKLVAWAVDLSKPNKEQRDFFGKIFSSDKFGKNPTARLAVVKQRQRRRYELLRQSPTVNLSGSLGRKQIFTLDKPLRVRKGQIIALTIPTWASNFATEISSEDNQWRASRRKGECNTQTLSNAKRSRPQQKVGSVRSYRCDYRGARLLYWAYFVRG